MRLPGLLLLTLLLTACNERPAPSTQDGQMLSGQVRQVSPTRPATLAVLLAGSENDPWTAELVTALGAELGFDPWELPGPGGHLDTLGPYQGKLGPRPVTVHIALAGFPALADLQSQTDLGADALEWVRQLEPDLVWLDGDQAQFAVGRELADELPIVFTGVVVDRQAYYGDGAEVTGLYRRHNLFRVLHLTRKRAPEASRFALVADDSPLSRGRVAKLRELLELSGEPEPLIPPPVSDWRGLKRQLGEIQTDCDAIILCGLGDEAGPEVLRSSPCPGDLLEGLDVPVVALGPTATDACGPLVLKLRPSAHAAAALQYAGLILAGGSAAAIPTDTPADMSVFESGR